jgi:DNA-binding MarR family transcriptional regulator
MIQTTSVLAYYSQLQTLGNKQIEVYEKLKELGSATNNELAKALDWEINRLTPRVFELREKGIVEECMKRACNITGRTAICWRIINY